MNLELMERVKAAILSDPQKVDMGCFESAHHHCGTTRCIAGWVIHLCGEQISTICDSAEIEGFEYEADAVVARAADLLDIPVGEAEYLFYPSSRNPYSDIWLHIDEIEEHSPAYAAIVVRAIDHAIERNGGAR